MDQLSLEILDYIEEHSSETYELLLTLGKIPAPSNQEEKRAEYCRDWLLSQGAENVYIDSALNVVYPIGCTKDNPVVVFMTHTDVVFPDTAPLPVVVEGGRIKAPGIGDDTANLCALLMCAKYIAGKKITPPDCGLLLIANAGEEGLGNLKGSRQIVKEYGDRIREFYSIDGYMDRITTDAVGSRRYEVEVLTEGGHSFTKFGNRNAIACLASMIDTLYTLRVPETKTKTTYNVGTISGGTSVNTIAQQAKMLYEFRSDSMEDLEFMEQHFMAVAESCRTNQVEVNTVLVGERPCSSGVDPIKQEHMINKVLEVVKKHTGTKPQKGCGSTDCNIPLSQGIPSICFGAVRGGGAHTRQEWVDIASLKEGYRVVFELILSCF
ncbi:M20/M25/M40 family metallo-hydrolase [Lacrimispora amygdalina]|uniref:M20/M25/M40 family metallo-hydrolase n=1 Tax=Lacrimispora amygdalina TaxID=253257 RepID=UPI001478A25A